MSRSILWLDNDPGYIYPLAKALLKAGFVVKQTRSVSAAQKLIDTGELFDLLLLDVMIPVTTDEEARGYDPATTAESHATGLEFYRRNREKLERTGKVVALTVRVDQGIRDDFVAAGLPPGRFVTKLEVREAPTFVSVIRKYLEGGVA